MVPPDAESAGKQLWPRLRRVGRSRRSWVKNCVAVGLSGGFIEPLESTAIYIIQSSLRWLVTYFPDSDFAPSLAGRFNSLLEQLYLEIRDFNILHYVTNNRTDDDFWHAARNDLAEAQNLSGTEPQLVAELEQELSTYLSQAGSPCPNSNPKVGPRCPAPKPKCGLGYELPLVLLPFLVWRRRSARATPAT